MPKAGTYVIIGGVVLLIVGISVTVLYTSWQKDKAAEVIRESWRLEAEALNSYLEQITAGGREPTDAEWDRYQGMMEEMGLKETRIYELSKSSFEKLFETATELASRWYLIPIAVASLVLGPPVVRWLGRKLFSNWFRFKCIRCKPPTCQVDGETFATESLLQDHMLQFHVPTTVAQNVFDAQAIFTSMPYYVQSGVAAEAGLYDRAYQDWRTFSPAELYAIAWGITAVIIIGAIALTLFPWLSPAVALLLI